MFLKDIRELYSKDLNFIPKRIVNRKRRQRQNFFILLLIVSITSTICAVSLIQVKMVAEYRVKIEEVNRDIAVLEKAAPVYEKLEQAKRDYQAKQAAMARIKVENSSFIDLFDQISLALPAGVYISSLNYQVGKGVELNVITRNPVDVARVVVALRNTGLFNEVTLQGKDIPMIPAEKPITFSLVFTGTDATEAENGQQSNKDEGDYNVADEIENEIENRFNIKTE